jgi:hypothetical protein
MASKCWRPAVVVSIAITAFLTRSVEGQGGATEAPTGFDNGTNGIVDQATHDTDRLVFEQVEDEVDGLGQSTES